MFNVDDNSSNENHTHLALFTYIPKYDLRGTIRQITSLDEDFFFFFPDWNSAHPQIAPYRPRRTALNHRVTEKIQSPKFASIPLSA